MQKYGMLLQSYVDNDRHVNNCVFTMMYHVAGDCGKSDVLLQPDILQTFTHILDEDIPITTVRIRSLNVTCKIRKLQSYGIRKKFLDM